MCQASLYFEIRSSTSEHFLDNIVPRNVLQVVTYSFLTFFFLSLFVEHLTRDIRIIQWYKKQSDGNNRQSKKLFMLKTFLHCHVYAQFTRNYSILQ